MRGENGDGDLRAWGSDVESFFPTHRNSRRPLRVNIYVPLVDLSGCGDELQRNDAPGQVVGSDSPPPLMVVPSSSSTVSVSTRVAPDAPSDSLPVSSENIAWRAPFDSDIPEPFAVGPEDSGRNTMSAKTSLSVMQHCTIASYAFPSSPTGGDGRISGTQYFGRCFVFRAREGDPCAFGGHSV